MENPEPFGMTKEQLELVARRVELAGPVRYCFLLAIEGHLLHEVYFHNASETRYEADSLAKTMIAQVVGVSVAKGLLDIDRPLADYGVQPRCLGWSASETRGTRRSWRKRRQRRRHQKLLAETEVTPACGALLRKLCPDVAPPFDCAAETMDRPMLPGSAQCSDRCLRDRHVQAELLNASCAKEAGVWCRRPPGGDGCWKDCQTGESYWPSVTARHLLTQSSGVGRYSPGTAFTYDSDGFIDHLAYLISKITNESSATWATREYALPMGLPPDLFAYDDFSDPQDGPEFSPGGGQMMTCRDHLRVAQLMINRGRWADDEGVLPGAAIDDSRPWRQLLTEEFVESMMRPNFPDAFTGYGMLSWLNAPPKPNRCCTPRWGSGAYLPQCGVPATNRSAFEAACHLQSCKVEFLFDHMIGDGITSQTAPRDLVLGMGQSAKYLMVVPSQGMAAVTLGLSWGSSQLCPMGKIDAGGRRMPNGTILPQGTTLNSNGYDDGFVAGQIWRAIGNISSIRVDARGEAKHAVEVAPLPTTHAPLFSPRLASQSGGNSSSSGGSCYCSCPPGMGFGACFNMPSTAKQGDCLAVSKRAAEVCPAHGMPRQCHNPPSPLDTDCQDVQLSHMACRLISGCQPLPGGGSHGLLPEEANLRFATCQCQPTVFEDGACEWDDSPCEYSPYYPPMSDAEAVDVQLVV